MCVHPEPESQVDGQGQFLPYLLYGSEQRLNFLELCNYKIISPR